MVDKQPPLFLFLFFYAILVHFITNRNIVQMYMYIEKMRDIEKEKDIEKERDI